MKKKQLIALAAFLTLSTQGALAQELSQRDMVNLFSEDSVTWAIPLDRHTNSEITWKKQTSSFDKDGIVTYCGYKGQDLVGTLAIDEFGNVMGTVYDDGLYQIVSNNGRIDVLKHLAKQSGCATERRLLTRISFDSEVFKADAPFHDGLFREYRLAVIFSKQEFNTKLFGGDIKKVRAYVAALETFLNNIYVRDLGVHFTLVNDDRLFKTNIDAAYMGEVAGTTNINNVIGKDAYDVGLQFASYGDDVDVGPSKAILGGAAYDVWKGNVMVLDQSMWTAAHELAHLLGGNHTFIKGNGTGAEPYPGQSILGYGHRYEFIGKSSMQEMLLVLKRLDRRLQSEGRISTSQVSNHAPIIDKNKMRSEYIIPKETFFQIPVYASDPDGDSLYYGRQEEDYRPYREAHFATLPPSRDNVMSFGRTYPKGGTNILPNSGSIPVNRYKMTFYVNDAEHIEKAIEIKKAPLYDIFTTTINVVEATPFKFTNFLQKQFNAGQKLKLTWAVDPNIFLKDSKVEISLSMDGGFTFPYILMPETYNDGECEVIMPNQEIGRMGTYGFDLPNGGHEDLFTMAKGVLKIRSLDEVVLFDLTDNNPNNGGFEVKAPTITFLNMPSKHIAKQDDKDALIDKNSVTAINAKGSRLNVEYKEEKEGDWTHRIWTAKDGDNVASIDQFVQQTHTTSISLLSTLNNEDEDQAFDITGRKIDNFTAKGIILYKGKKIFKR